MSRTTGSRGYTNSRPPTRTKSEKGYSTRIWYDIPASNVFERRVRQQTLERLGTPYLLQEIQDVIEAWGVSTLDEYQALERRGRGVPLKANIREALWAVYQTWHP